METVKAEGVSEAQPNGAGSARHATAPALELEPGLVGAVDAAIEGARNALLALQRPEGYWIAPLEANAQMNAQYIIFCRFMGETDLQLQEKLKKLLLELQQPDGSWNLFPGAEGDLSTTIEAYFALKLAGLRPGDPPLMEARRWVLRRSGIIGAGTLTRFYLAAMGQVPWSATVALPVELALLPGWFPFNLYRLSCWTRGTLMALMLLGATRPVVPTDYREGVLELYLLPAHFTRFKLPAGKRRLSLRGVFNVVNRLLALYGNHPLPALRRRAVAYVERWLLSHQDANGSWGGIEPCYLLSAMALKGLGYRNDHPVLRRALEASRELIWDYGDKALYMPCVSPNWDSALAAKALLDSGLPAEHPALRAAARWFVERQIFRPGDWSVKRPQLEPGGWAFQFSNDWYPDVDDSAVILMVLAAVESDDREARQRALAAGARWVLGMQGRDGGFAAFDADNDAGWLNHLPFAADTEAANDPACPDLAGRVLEMMAAVGYTADHPAARRAIDWLRRHQESDGAWWGRWGVNYVYGTFSALSGLGAIGVDAEQPWIKRAVAWLKSAQNPDGGWGESCLSYTDRAWRGRGASTPSQTAWALIGLLSGEKAISQSARRAAAWLIERQRADGGWNEELFTGTGFPGHFYLSYHLYAHYFPLMALGRLRQRLASLNERPGDRQ